MQISNIWSFRQLFNICRIKYKINLRGLDLLKNSQQCCTNGNWPKKLKLIYHSLTERKTVSDAIYIYIYFDKISTKKNRLHLSLN